MTSIYGTDSVGFKNVMGDYIKALRLLQNLEKAVQKAQSDYARGWKEAIEQKALEKARVAAETFLLIVQDPVNHFVINDPKPPCECGLDDVTPRTCPAHKAKVTS